LQLTVESWTLKGIFVEAASCRFNAAECRIHKFDFTRRAGHSMTGRLVSQVMASPLGCGEAPLSDLRTDNRYKKQEATNNTTPS